MVAQARSLEISHEQHGDLYLLVNMQRRGARERCWCCVAWDRTNGQVRSAQFEPDSVAALRAAIEKKPQESIQ